MIISDSFTNSLFANICFIISEFPTNIYLSGGFENRLKSVNTGGGLK